ncbi:hypothetical protein PUV54_03180 [Hyphococcus flavus]|uniref:Uncharacterized protein n=1 Tax=Hyphococcus flavus TaxID=1866326 RepID=A0AAE9ZCG3_9PROT|nr:hypothetical protein [Hyphococcus flavus]WDI32194.1 hypothetical protein PUV54_03180 [Hyphococcus flavus]
MLGIVKLVRQTIEGSVVAMVLIGVVAMMGSSETINILLSDLTVTSALFLLVIAIVLADLIAKVISIFNTTFPDLVPDLDKTAVKRAWLINRLQPGQTIALLSGAYAARVALFLIIFSALGLSYASAPQAVQENLFGDYAPVEAIDAFIRQGVAGSIGYFLFFLGPDNLKPITSAVIDKPIVSASVDGDVFLAGIRLYGFAFVLAVLRTLVTPVTYVRARLRSRKLSGEAELAA